MMSGTLVFDRQTGLPDSDLEALGTQADRLRSERSPRRRLGKDLCPTSPVVTSIPVHVAAAKRLK
jgi:hypothetical protein